MFRGIAKGPKREMDYEPRLSPSRFVLGLSRRLSMLSPKEWGHHQPGTTTPELHTKQGPNSQQRSSHVPLLAYEDKLHLTGIGEEDPKYLSEPRCN